MHDELPVAVMCSTAVSQMFTDAVLVCSDMSLAVAQDRSCRAHQGLSGITIAEPQKGRYFIRPLYVFPAVCSRYLHIRLSCQPQLEALIAL